MFNTSNRRKPSQRKPRARPFGKLTIDTRWATHGKPVPQQESRLAELSFVSFEESKARKNYARHTDIQHSLGHPTPVLPGPNRIGEVHTTNINNNALSVPLSTRVKGLRPSPLDLSEDVSPAHLAIPTGIALPSASASNYHVTPYAAVHYGTEVTPPMIVVTPAEKDQFAPDEVEEDIRPRSASSIYSRYTNCMTVYEPVHGPGNTAPPPVPALPLSFADAESHNHPSHRGEGQDNAKDRLPICSPTNLPTPRRSKGWWNIITSPFSAKSAVGFWRSPSLSEESGDRTPMLSNVAAMGETDRGIDRFGEHNYGYDGPHSAPAANASALSSLEGLKRSFTAPGALNRDAPDMNIYQIPTSGAAAAYYDVNRHFPSLCLESTPLPLADQDRCDWSPSHSVYMPEREIASPESGAEAITKPRNIASPPTGLTISTVPRPKFVKPASTKAAVFATPSEDEMQTPEIVYSPHTPEVPHATEKSFRSPLSATPTVENAHIGRVVGPKSSFGEQRTVKIERTPTPPGPAIVTREESHAIVDAPKGNVLTYKLGEKPAARPMHSRQDSHGLGITDGGDDLFPAPKPLHEKLRLETDRFGQLTVRSCEETPSSPRPWYRRFNWLLATLVGTLLVVGVGLVVVFTPQKQDDMPIENRYLNLTGFPPMVVGVTTVIQPRNLNSTDTCVPLPNLWSCHAPSGSIDSKPNFRFLIRFRNGTLPSNETALATSAGSITKRWQNNSRLHQFMRRSLWTNYLYSASPAAPPKTDQTFVGRTTDSITVPFDGEETPFYISLLDPVALSISSIHRRHSNFTYPYPIESNEQSNTTASTSPTDKIPAPALNSNSEPMDPVFYPFVSSQPLRLYNRGLDTEHYGFYTYFDRSVYVSGSISNASASYNLTSNVALNNASAVCTFSQTRLHMQIWTKRDAVAALSNTTVTSNTPAANSSGNVMIAPGSFPFRVTITLDRHGGVAAGKGVYCYGLDDEHHVLGASKEWIFENRAAGGTLVNPAGVPGGNDTDAGGGTLSKRDGGEGIDGGTGGCNCAWANWS